jgi:flagellar hook-basal body complex protein FliE
MSIDTSKINWLTDTNRNLKAENEESEKGSFKSLLNGMINNVIETENQTKVDAYNLSIGNMDDMHTMMINEMKAEIALQTMVNVRNKLVDAYKEIMNTNI